MHFFQWHDQGWGHLAELGVVSQDNRLCSSTDKSPVGTDLDDLAVGQPMLQADRLDTIKEFIGAELSHTPIGQMTMQGLFTRSDRAAQGNQVDSRLVDQ